MIVIFLIALVVLGRKAAAGGADAGQSDVGLSPHDRRFSFADRRGMRDIERQTMLKEQSLRWRAPRLRRCPRGRRRRVLEHPTRRRRKAPRRRWRRTQLLTAVEYLSTYQWAQPAQEQPPDQTAAEPPKVVVSLDPKLQTMTDITPPEPLTRRFGFGEEAARCRSSSIWKSCASASFTPRWRGYWNVCWNYRRQQGAGFCGQARGEGADGRGTGQQLIFTHPAGI